MKTNSALVSLTSILCLGCATEPKRVLQTGVNESLPRSEVPIPRNELATRRQDDLGPYAGLTIEGPLPKRDVIRAIQRHRKRFDACYRGIIGDRPSEPGRVNRPAYEPRENEYKRGNSSMKPDGMLDSTNYSTPHHETLPTRSGEVVLNFTVGSDGKVREARSSLSDFGSSMRVCLENAMATLPFAPQNGDSRVRFLTLRFSNETRALKEGE